MKKNKTSRSTKRPESDGGAVRIQKYLAQVGIASRRAVEEMVLLGQIEVNGQPITKLPCFVTPGEDEIVVEGRRIGKRRRAEEKVYFLLNKPRNVVCTSRDPQGRRTAIDFLPPIRQRVYTVGRLDADSTGLILLTNDGELTQHLTHPSGEVPKTYIVAVDGSVEEEQLNRLKRGVYLDGKRTAGAGVKIEHRGPGKTLLRITLREGRNREIRRMLVRLGHQVRRLKRVAIGPITDKGLGVGQVRSLSPKEVGELRKTGQGGTRG
ncbi:MAG: rRNA pseudouridine synthase [Phycisphaerae bacterium]|nr:rRNA pseudouridine synthase [Phycisphaerae bacterium]